MTVVIDGTTGIDTIQDGAVATADIANGAVTPTKQSQPMTLGTAQATTSGTSIDFTGIPSWVKRITMMFNGVSTNGISNYMVRIGDGAISSTGYISTCQYGTNNTQDTVGFVVSNGVTSTEVYTGNVVLLNMGSNVWSQNGTLGTSLVRVSSGAKTLSGTLDRIRLTTVNGTDTFDAGSVNILYEG